MEIHAKSADRNLLLEFFGEMDHHGARNALREMEVAVDAALPKTLMLDMEGVTFMDSSGLGVILGRYRVIAGRGGRVLIGGANRAIDRILRMAGIYTLAEHMDI